MLEELIKKIKRMGSKFVVTSEDGSKELGSYDSQEEAVERLRQIEGHKTKKSDITIERSIFKADDDKKLVYGVVLEPGEIDAQGDMCDECSIEKAAHEYLMRSRVVGKQHETKAQAGVVESYIAPKDDPEMNIKKGSWIMVVKVHDQKLWEAVKNGEFTGFSIGGKGIRTPVEPVEPIEEKEE